MNIVLIQSLGALAMQLHGEMILTIEWKFINNENFF